MTEVSRSTATNPVHAVLLSCLSISTAGAGQGSACRNGAFTCLFPLGFHSQSRSERSEIVERSTLSVYSICLSFIDRTKAPRGIFLFLTLQTNLAIKAPTPGTISSVNHEITHLLTAWKGIPLWRRLRAPIVGASIVEMSLYGLSNAS